MKPSTIKSRPLYGTLAPVPQATQHIAIVEGEGALALADAFAGHEALRRTIILFSPIAHRADHDQTAVLTSLSCEALHLASNVQELLGTLVTILSTATMGTRLYVSGSEDFIGRVTSEALRQGIEMDAIQTEHRGAPTRRVQCVHCKGFIDGVSASPALCPHCGLHLLVRDHYSRRLGAFMGVSIDAESPGDLPPPEAFGA
ncbi:hypothetical protein EPK99_03585 [Neorhizobium lilium]|uniref:Uncharacterized protein n=1 Tax=Neorhizobium lilium TaxID=2503024 RepID=A0A444LM86_9HYPH|nr:dimethylamine monooxygenase subunit DmmA family protein [Neorhizobium lilium]RWX81398.1 hypothetical protein EPK99_03585 [Neorhizobium lilium]